jgi:nucleoid-associated protein YgaU
MGLLSFAKNIGKKLFGNEDEAPEKLKKHIEESNPGINNLDIQVKDGVATIKGDTDDPSALEKVILMAGNALGIEEVRADEVTSPAQTATVEYYEVKKGDSLWKIAQNAYGDGNRHPDIFEANKEVIQNPDLIFPGQMLRIPKD